ncbi:MAG: ABC transporter substrate-binding protein, partial [Bacillota bacterium]|nr:ABC transporter substrate-binding protein [Bacillota bacterium]
MAKKVTGLLLLAAMITALTGCGAKPPEPAAKPPEPKEIRIPIIAPLSGPLASGPGKQAQEGANLATKLVNAKGGIGGKQLVLDWLDDRGQASEATVLAQKVADDKRYPVVLAHFTSDACFATMPIYEKAGMAMLTPWASHVELTTRSGISFRMSQSTAFAGGLNAEIITDLLKSKSAAIILANAEYHKDHAKHLKAGLEAKKVPVVKEELYMVGDSNFKPQITNILAAKPAVLAVVGYPRETGLIINQAREMGYKGPITIAPGGGAPELFEISAKNMTETYMGGGSTFREALAGTNLQNKAAVEYITEFRKEYKRDPSGGWDSQAYDLIRVMAQVLAKTGTDRAKTLEELKKVKDFEGVIGKLFGSDRAMVPESGVNKFDQKLNQWGR